MGHLRRSGFWVCVLVVYYFYKSKAAGEADIAFPSSDSCSLGGSFSHVNSLHINQRVLHKHYGTGRNLSRKQVRHLMNCILDHLYLTLMAQDHADKCIQAKQAFTLRANVKSYARERGSWWDTQQLRMRDVYTYGSLNGPSFDSLYTENAAKLQHQGVDEGLREARACQGITESAIRTNPWYNQRYDDEGPGRPAARADRNADL